MNIAPISYTNISSYPPVSFKGKGTSDEAGKIRDEIAQIAGATMGNSGRDEKVIAKEQEVLKLAKAVKEEAQKNYNEVLNLLASRPQDGSGKIEKGDKTVSFIQNSIIIERPKSNPEHETRMSTYKWVNGKYVPHSIAVGDITYRFNNDGNLLSYCKNKAGQVAFSEEEIYFDDCNNISYYRGINNNTYESDESVFIVDNKLMIWGYPRS